LAAHTNTTFFFIPMGVNVFPVPVGAIYCINEFSGLFAIDNNDF